MRPRRAILAAFLAMALGVVAGCAARKHPAPPPAHPVVARPPAPTPEQIVRMEATNAAVVEARAEAMARFATGIAQQAEGNDAAALAEWYAAALADLEHEELVVNLSRQLVQSGQAAKARDLLLKATAHPKAPGVYFALLGWSDQMLGRKAEALTAAQKAVSLSPTNLAGYQVQANLHLQDQQPQEALKILDQAARQPGDGVFFIDLAELMLKCAAPMAPDNPTNKARLLPVLDHARSQPPEAIGYQIKLAELYNAIGEPRQAVELYLKMQEKFANVPALRDSIRAKLTELYLKGKDRKKAAEQLEAIVKEYPLNAQAYYFLGGLAYEDREYAKAAEHFAKTILLNPDFESGYYDTAAAQISAGKAKEALEVLERARKKFSQNFTLEYYTGMARMRAKNYVEAVNAFTAAEIVAGATDPARLTPVFYFQLGAALERVKRYVEAENNFQKCLDADPKFAEALNYLGYMWAERGINLERARAMLQKALDMEPKNAAFLDSMGWVCFKLGQLDKARELVEKAIELNTEPDATLHDHLGDILAALQQWDPARAQWEKALAIEPTDEIKQKLERARHN
jgi:tetratricopeptide (TPR) repeat protein